MLAIRAAASNDVTVGLLIPPDDLDLAARTASAGHAFVEGDQRGGKGSGPAIPQVIGSRQRRVAAWWRVNACATDAISTSLTDSRLRTSHTSTGTSLSTSRASRMSAGS
jgi:hypothetical protein